MPLMIGKRSQVALCDLLSHQGRKLILIYVFIYFFLVGFLKIYEVIDKETNLGLWRFYWSLEDFSQQRKRDLRRREVLGFCTYNGYLETYLHLENK